MLLREGPAQLGGPSFLVRIREDVDTCWICLSLQPQPRLRSGLFFCLDPIQSLRNSQGWCFTAVSHSSEALQRIEKVFRDFRAAIERCRKSQPGEPADLQDAYSRLARLRERYEREKDHRNLNQTELEPLSNVFVHNKFIEGLMNIRNVGDHVEMHENFFVSTPDMQIWDFEVGSSAFAFFSGPAPNVVDIAGVSRRIDHVNWLGEAEKLIDRAIVKAKQ